MSAHLSAKPIGIRVLVETGACWLGFEEFLELSEHDSPLAIVWQGDAAKGFGRLASIAMLGVGEVPATLFEGVAGLFQPF